MKYPYLFTSLCCLLLIYCSKWQINVVLILFFCIYYRHYFQQHFLWFLSCLCVAFTTVFLQVKPMMPNDTIITITELHSNYCIGKVDHQKVILYNIPSANFDDVIKVQGTYEEIDGIHNEGEFHFPTWANRKGIYYAMNVESSEVLDEGHTLRHQLYQHISSLEPQSASWLKLVLFQIRDEQREISYMASSSGMHIQFLLSIWKTVARLFFSDLTIMMSSILMLVIVGISTTFHTSILRMLCTRMVYFLFPAHTSKDRLGIVILFFICLSPASVYELGFLLPICLQFVYNFNIHHIKRIFITFLCLIPIQFFFFQYIDFFQILLFPLLRIIYGLCYGFAWMVLLLPGLSCFLPLFETLQQVLTNMGELFPKWYYLPNSLWILLWCHYGGLYLDKKKRKEMLHLLVLLLYTQGASYLNPFLQVQMIDVGQGDATLFILPFHQGTMLLDVAGHKNKNIPEDIIVPMLQKRGIHYLDKVVITHDDFDHIGGLSQLLQLIEVKEVITTKQAEIDLYGYRFSSPLYEHTYDNANDNSILLSLQVFGYHLLFMGDCSMVCEEDIIREYPNLKADILKIGHHGSKYSSSPAFIHQVDPLIALISSGRHNRYGHPNEEVMTLLENEEVYSLLTAKQGSCTFYFSKYISFYKTADGEFGIINHR